jgi:hypothetical protein
MNGLPTSSSIGSASRAAARLALGGTSEGCEWIEAFNATRSSWAAAYRCAPALARERALASVADDRDRCVWVGDRTCEWCGELIEEDRRATALYCSRRCKDAAFDQRVAA